MPSTSVAETAASLPSGEPIDSAAPVPIPTKTPPALASIRTTLAAAPSNTDAFLTHLHKCMQTRAGFDVVLLFLCYSTRLGGNVLESLSRPVLRHAARRLVAKAFSLPPATTISLTSPPASAAAATALRLAGSLTAFSAMISEWRCMTRLFGLLGLYFNVRKLLFAWRGVGKKDAEAKEEKDGAVTKSASEKHFDFIIAHVQVISLLLFQSCENIAFLSSKKVLSFPPATQQKLALFSVRSWGVYVGVEAGRLLVERSRKLSSGAANADALWKAEWKKSFTRNLAWAPLTVHWGMPNGPLPDLVVALLASYPAVGQMLDLWRGTQ